jgi:hypothetical protein
MVSEKYLSIPILHLCVILDVELTVTMTDPKTAIQERIRKLQAEIQRLRELAADPVALALMRDLVPVAENGHKAAGRGTRQTGPKQMPIPQIRKRAVRGEQQRKTEEALAAATEPVTTDWIVAKMQELGHEFKAAKPKVAVNECLREAEREGRARLVKTEGVANFWEVVS